MMIKTLLSYFRTHLYQSWVQGQQLMIGLTHIMVLNHSLWVESQTIHPSVFCKPRVTLKYPQFKRYYCSWTTNKFTISCWLVTSLGTAILNSSFPPKIPFFVSKTDCISSQQSRKILWYNYLLGLKPHCLKKEQDLLNLLIYL